ncbi:MAG TPA: amino acid racemase [Rhizomicrobium sp.]|nr:amino acid racemase [Rhizomicrobium sp.]
MAADGGEKTVGVIGGMGPEATVDFLRRLVARTPARDDVDHLHVLVDNNPKIPSRIAALIDGTGEDPTPVLCGMAQGLEAQGADFLVMPCNTAHYYLPAIARAVGIPVLDMVLLAIGKLSSGPRRIGLLASPAVRLVGLYKARMEQAGLDVLFPDAPHEERILRVIKAVKAGKQGAEEQKDYSAVAQHLRHAGAGALLIACTELSVLTLPELGCPVVDTLDVLVEATIDAARG